VLAGWDDNLAPAGRVPGGAEPAPDLTAPPRRPEPGLVEEWERQDRREAGREWER